MEKTHKVRLIGRGLIYEKHYPGADPLVIDIPAGASVEIDQATIDGLTRMNNTKGRPTHEFERLGDGDAVDFSIVDAVAKVDAELAAKGVTIKGRPTRPTARGKYKGLFAEAGATSIANIGTAEAPSERVDTGSTVAAKKQGGK